MLVISIQAIPVVLKKKGFNDEQHLFTNSEVIQKHLFPINSIPYKDTTINHFKYFILQELGINRHGK